MNFKFNNKVAIVTGGSKGIGREISLKLASYGAKVVIIARNKKEIDETCNIISDSNGTAIGISIDITCENSVKDAVIEIKEKFGRIDILINNAGGVNKFCSFQDTLNIDWIESFNLNVMGCVNFVKAVEQDLLASKNGKIIFISSIVGVQPGYSNPHYSITKAATINLSKHLSNIYSNKGITCNVICPGPVHTDSWNQNVQTIAKLNNISFDEAYIKLDSQERNKIPLARIGEPDDIVPMVIFLLSDYASWITGSCFHISGGKLSTMN